MHLLEISAGAWPIRRAIFFYFYNVFLDSEKVINKKQIFLRIFKELIIDFADLSRNF
jgi:hypothetical protein